MQGLLLQVLGNDSFKVLSNTTARIDYGVNPMRDVYTQFFGYGMTAKGQGYVSDIDIYWPNVGSLGVNIDGLPYISLADLFAVVEAKNPFDALNQLLSRSDWTAQGTNLPFGETFWGFYSAETIIAGGGDDYYRASMGIGQARDIVDRFDGGAGVDSVGLQELATGVHVDMALGRVTFAETVGGVRYDRSLEMVSVEELSGTRYRDIMLGSDGDDILFGGGGHDVIRGGGGADELVGDGGDDRILGGAGADRINGGRGDDQLFGGGGADMLFGSDGDDLLAGGGGADQLDGGEGRDLLKGEGGDDVLTGGAGRDRLIGGRGDDILEGGRDGDVFVFKTGGAWQGEDQITDFNLRQDRLVLQGGDAVVTVSHDGGDTVIDYDGGSVRLLGVLWPEEGVLSL